jgi:hypothetical protein
MRVSAATVAALRTRLCAVVIRAPSAFAAEVKAIIEMIERDCRVADPLRRE